MITHGGEPQGIAVLLAPLNLGAEILGTESFELDATQSMNKKEEARTLKIVLAINAGMFVGELIGAFLADSSALLADSLDMFGEATEMSLSPASTRFRDF